MAVLIAVIAVLVIVAIAVLVVRARSARASQVSQPTSTELIKPPPPPPGTPPPIAPGDDDTSVAPAVAPERDDALSDEPGPATYRERMGRTRGIFATLRARGASSGVSSDVVQDLEDALLRADVGVATTEHLMDTVRSAMASGSISHVDELVQVLRDGLLDVLGVGPDGQPIERELDTAVDPGRVCVWLFVGVNGVGKTTTIAKLAAREVDSGKTVLLAAGDTFRAAAGDQLSSWGQRVGAEVVRGAEGGDPSAVVFDAIQRASARHVDLVLADTAGRLHTKVNLIEELKKIRRVADREPGQVTEVLLVLDATTGQNAVSQAREFSDAVGATGVVLTKLDGTARGGVVVAIQREVGLPVKLVGLGEGPADLVVFDPASFADALLEP